MIKGTNTLTTHDFHMIVRMGNNTSMQQLHKGKKGFYLGNPNGKIIIDWEALLCLGNGHKGVHYTLLHREIMYLTHL